MKIENMKSLFIKVIVIILLFTLINVNNSYAITTKEDIELYKEYLEEYRKKEMKKGFQGTEYKDAIYYVSASKKAIDSETGEEYIASSFGGGISSEKEGGLEFYHLIMDLFKVYFDKNLDESLPDEERLLDYFISGIFPYTREENFKYGDDIEIKISAFVIPASEKTIWAKNKEKVYTGAYQNYKLKVALEGYNTDEYYMHFKMQDGKYNVSYIGNMPEGFDDYVERMKARGIDLENIDYAELINSKTETELIAESVQVENFEMENVINTKSNINIATIIICSLGLTLTIILAVKRIKQKEN